MPLDAISDTFLDLGVDGPEEISRRHARLILERAAQLVERGWCRGTMARCGLVSFSDAASPYVNKWCASGAIHRAAHELRLNPDRARWYLTQVALIAGYPSIAKWNDYSWSRRRVLAGFRRAMEMA